MTDVAPAPNGGLLHKQTRSSFLAWHRHHAALLSGFIAVALSMAGSWRPSIWYDEAATLSAVHRPWASLWKLIHHVDVVHFFYYSLLRCWVYVFGSTTFSVRALSALLLGATCVMGVAVCREILGVGPTQWAAVTFPLLPGLTWCGLDARSTALSCFTTMAATWVVLRADRANQRRWWALYALTVVLTVAAQLLTVLIVAVHFFLVKNRRAWAFSLVVPMVMAVAFADVSHSQSIQLAWLKVTIPEATPSLLFSQNVLGLRSDAGVSPTGTFWGVNWPASAAIKSLKAQKITHVLFLYEWTKPLTQRPEVRELQQVGCHLQWVSTLRRTNAAWFVCH